ncbi:MAG: hypothetical protein R3B72_10970 [Polyangiaceae bacterium]
MLILLAACGDPRNPAPSPSTGTAPSSTVSAAPSASVSGGTTTLKRRVDPVAARQADERACDEGKAEACRRMADRHRGYGAIAGCGLAREGDEPRLKWEPEDTEHDAERYLHFIRKACDQGDAEACFLERSAQSSWRFSTHAAESDALRSSLAENALWLWATGKGTLAEMKEALAVGADRKNPHYLALSRAYARRDEDKPKDGSLPEAYATRALAICEATLQCDDVMMMLDKDGLRPEGLAPLRAKMGEILVDACLDGACVCGEAIRFLAPEDPRRPDLAQLGCGDGEAEGCYEVARLHEEGLGLAKDEAAMHRHLALACPPLIPIEAGFGPRRGDYSPRACDRIAQHYAEGAYPPKRFEEATYYARAACAHPGYEPDHLPCVRRARFATSAPNTIAREESGPARGPEGTPVFTLECTRPSVAAECKSFEDWMARGRPQPN